MSLEIKETKIKILTFLDSRYLDRVLKVCVSDIQNQKQWEICLLFRTVARNE